MSIEHLRRQIEYEKAMYQTACEHPTETPQFYAALDKTRVRIQEMEAELRELEQS